ncbi:MAG: 50S ribosomal protein L3 N(5)-glutamine methyltransferase [Aestuariivirgaceae bacterium]
MNETPPDQLAQELITLRDILRYAVSRFSAANLAYGHGTANALDEAVFLILESLHLPIGDVNPFADARLTLDERRMLLARIAERITTRKPASYLLRRAYVGLEPFYVDERVIVPRSFIGELLLSGTLTGEASSLIADPAGISTVLDLCTGSGCLAIIAAQRFSAAAVHATDISLDALEVARINIAARKLESRITLLHGDLYQPLGRNRYDLILANPPYVDAVAMSALPPEYRHEPEMALAGGVDGLDVVRRILLGAPRHLSAAGMLVCEIGRGRETLERFYPGLPFLWLDTEESEGEVFCIAAEDLR